jgi:predicted restriction endonuclease
MAQCYLEKKDPVIRAQRVLSKKIKTERPPTSTELEPRGQPHQIFLNSQDPDESPSSTSKNKTQETQDLSFRKPIPTDLKHRVYLRDQGQCQKDDCHDSRWIDIHHIKPVSQGGLNILENLITLCKAHHHLEHAGL